MGIRRTMRIHLAIFPLLFVCAAAAKDKPVVTFHNEQFGQTEDQLFERFRSIGHVDNFHGAGHWFITFPKSGKLFSRPGTPATSTTETHGRTDAYGRYSATSTTVAHPGTPSSSYYLHVMIVYRLDASHKVDRWEAYTRASNSPTLTE